MTDSTENATPPKSTKSRNSDSSVQIQIQPKFHFQVVPRDDEESEFLDLVDFGEVAFSEETVVGILHHGKKKTDCSASEAEFSFVM